MSIDYLFCHLQELMQVITDSFSDYYVPNVEIKDFNVFIDGKSFFDLPVKNEEEAYEKIMYMSSNNDYTTSNLWDFAYFKENYNLIAIDLSRQTKLKDLQQISFIGKLSATQGTTMFFLIEKSEETTLKFLQNSVTIILIMEIQKTLKNLQQKNGMLSTVSQKLIIHTHIQ